MKFGLALGLAGFILSLVFGSAFIMAAKTVSETKLLEHHGIMIQGTIVESYSESDCSGVSGCSLVQYARYQFEDAQGQMREGAASWQDTTEPLLHGHTAIKLLVDPLDGTHNRPFNQVRNIGRDQFLIGAIATLSLLMMAAGAMIGFVGYQQAKQSGDASQPAFRSHANAALVQSGRAAH